MINVFEVIRVVFFMLTRDQRPVRWMFTLRDVNWRLESCFHFPWNYFPFVLQRMECLVETCHFKIHKQHAKDGYCLQFEAHVEWKLRYYLYEEGVKKQADVWRTRLYKLFLRLAYAFDVVRRTTSLLNHVICRSTRFENDKTFVTNVLKLIWCLMHMLN